MDMTGSDQAILAAAMALAMGLVKVLEKVFDWATKRGKNGHAGAVTVLLDPESSRMMRETYEKNGHVHDVVSRTDNDGIPMVYTPRSYLDNQLRMAEALRDVSKQSESTAQKIEDILRELKK